MTRTARKFRWPVLLLFAFSLVSVRASHAAPGPATITYRRVFKGSTPEFIEIKVTDQGKCTYDIRQMDEDADAEPFEVGTAVRQKIFELTGDLKNFEVSDLDIHKKIADLGQKTFRYERGSEVHEAKFNYTLNATANQLMQIFEGLARQQGDLDLLEQRIKYDRLGVNDALLQFESDMDHRLLPEPERLLPALDRIAADPHFMDITRTKARSIAERIRNFQDR
jgi:hypothetical protein